MTNTDIDTTLETMYKIYNYKIRAMFVPRLLCVNFYYDGLATSLSKQMLDRITPGQLIEILLQTFGLEAYGGDASYEFLYNDVVNDEDLFNSEIEQAFHDAGQDWAYIV